MNKRIDEQLLTKYLMGELSPEEQMELEDRYFNDDELYEQLQTFENDMIDNYVRGRLPEHQLEQFKKHYLASPHRRKKVEFADTLVEHINSVTEKEELVHETETESETMKVHKIARTTPLQSIFKQLIPIFKYGFAPAAIAAMFFLIMQIRGLDNIVNQLETEQKSLLQKEQILREQINEQITRGNQLEETIQSERDLRAQLEQKLTNLKTFQPTVVSFVLESGGARRDIATQKKYIISNKADFIQFLVYLKTDEVYNSYRAVIQTADADEVWSQDGLQARQTALGKAISLKLPANILFTEDYTLELKGITGLGDIEDIDSYPISIQKK